MARRLPLLFFALSLEVVAAQGQSLQLATEEAYGRLPMRFEKNEGQTDARVRFVARGAGYGFFVTDTETVAVLQKGGSAPAVVRTQLVGSNQAPSVKGEELLEGKSHYLVGSDLSKWRTNVPQFGRVRTTGVYDGIDVAYYGNQGEIEYDFVVAPGSDPGQVRMRFQGAKSVELDPLGDLVLRVAGGEMRQRAPVVYQERDGSRHPVQARYRRLGRSTFGVALGAYDTALPLIIDPVLSW